MTAAAPYTTSVHIDADPDRIFDYFTKPEAIVRWMGDYAALDPTPGGQFALDINGVPVRGRYLEVDRPRRLLLSWGHAGSERLPPGASTVEVTITPHLRGGVLDLDLVQRREPRRLGEQSGRHAEQQVLQRGRRGVGPTALGGLVGLQPKTPYPADHVGVAVDARLRPDNPDALVGAGARHRLPLVLVHRPHALEVHTSLLGHGCSLSTCRRPGCHRPPLPDRRRPRRAARPADPGPCPAAPQTRRRSQPAPRRPHPRRAPRPAAPPPPPRPAARPPSGTAPARA